MAKETKQLPEEYGVLDILIRQLLSLRDGVDAALMMAMRVRGSGDGGKLTADEERRLEEARKKLDPPRWNPSSPKDKEEKE